MALYFDVKILEKKQSPN